MSEQQMTALDREIEAIEREAAPAVRNVRRWLRARLVLALADVPKSSAPKRQEPSEGQKTVAVKPKTPKDTIHMTPLKKPGSGVPVSITVLEIIRRMEAGENAADIAKAEGCSVTCINKRLAQAQVKRPHPKCIVCRTAPALGTNANALRCMHCKLAHKSAKARAAYLVRTGREAEAAQKSTVFHAEA